MAYVTRIGAAPPQVEYRLTGAHGCAAAEVGEAQFSYHADGAERPLVWTGAGLREVGIEPGTVLDEGQFDVARALMRGVNPRTGEQLVAPKLAVHEDAKVPCSPLVAAVREAAAEAGVVPADLFGSKKILSIYQRAVRAVADGGDGAVLRADEAGMVSDAAGLDADAVWGQGAYAAAAANLVTTEATTAADGSVSERVVPRRRVVGNLGYDLSFTLPKSHSLLLAFAEEGTATAVEGIYTEQVAATFDWLEAQTAYGMRGKHGEGKNASTVPSTGFLGWSMVHRSARPVGDRVVGDPHWHVHVTIANMARGSDGKWSTVAAGGRDLMRHAPAADHVLKALVRAELASRFGVQFARSERTGAWEVAAIPDETLRAFSKRGASIEAMLRDLGFDPELATRRAQDLAAAHTREAKTHTTTAPDTTLRGVWQAEARTLGIDPDHLAAQALPGAPGAPAAPTPGQPAARGAGERSAVRGAGTPDDESAAPDEGAAMSREGGEQELVDQVLARLLDPQDGLTSSMRRFTRVDALAAVADAMPAGAGDVGQIEGLTDRVLLSAGIVPLPGPLVATAQDDPELAPGAAPTPAGERRQLGAVHMRNAERFTTADIVDAERLILTTAARSADGQRAARVSPLTATMAQVAVEVGQGFELSAEQGAIVERLVTSDRQLDAVLGPPGTGKTTLLRAARAAWEAGGHTVVGAATAAVAVQNLAAESGIASRTVAQVVVAIRAAQDARACVAARYPVRAEGLSWAQAARAGAPRMGAGEQAKVDQAARGGLVGVGVLVLDEANLTDDRDRAVLYAEALATGTKVVEVGDPQQLRGVGCGSLFGRVHELVEGAGLSANRRQREEDERAAITAWRSGKYATALSSWSARGRLVATETGEEALTAMVATWMRQRTGAPDAHQQMRGVVMLAASNEAVERLNDAAQSVRAVIGELGPARTYRVRGGQDVRLQENDYVMIRLNDRRQRRHTGPDVLNGYRGTVESIAGDGTVHVAFEVPTDDGHQLRRAALSPGYVAAGGVRLGYAMTAHKAEGLTVTANWRQDDGTHQGGTVLVYAPGMDEPALHVATTRHRDRMFLFAGRDQLESADQTYERGAPDSEDARRRRVIAALADQARSQADNANDRPVLEDLHQMPARARPAPEPALAPAPVAASTPAHREDLDQRWQRVRERAKTPAAATAAPATPETAAAARPPAPSESRWEALRRRRRAGGRDVEQGRREHEARKAAEAQRRDEATRPREHGGGPRLR